MLTGEGMDLASWEEIPSFDQSLSASSLAEKCTTCFRVTVVEQMQRWGAHQPSSRFRKIWCLISLFFSIYYLFVIPFRAAFFSDNDITIPLLVLDAFTDLFFLLDLYCRWRFFYDEEMDDIDFSTGKYYRSVLGLMNVTMRL